MGALKGGRLSQAIRAADATDAVTDASQAARIADTTADLTQDATCLTGAAETVPASRPPQIADDVLSSTKGTAPGRVGGRLTGASEGKSPPCDPKAVATDLESQYPGQVTSSTIPPPRSKNMRLAGARHPSGVVFDPRGFPIFDDVAAFETRLPQSTAAIMKRRTHFEAATRDLAESISSWSSTSFPIHTRATESHHGRQGEDTGVHVAPSSAVRSPAADTRSCP
jgi:hypothetical protein